MMTKWEKLEGSKGILTVTVEGARWEKALDKAFNQLVKDAKVDGFRKGKMPRAMFEKKFGKQSLYPEAIEFALEDVYVDAIEEANIFPVAQPDVNIESVDDNKAVIKLTITVKPEVTLGDYKGLAVEETTVEINEEDVMSEIEKLREKHAELMIKDGAVEEGDTAVIDFEGFNEGVAFEGGKGENYPLVIGSGSFIPGFEEQLIGMKVGETKDINVTFPAEYHAEDLAGQPVVFKVTINEVKRREVPALTDEFVKEVNLEGIETVEALKADARTRLENYRKQEAENKIIDQLVDMAANNAKVEIPEAMIDSEIGRMMREFEQTLSQQGLNLQMYYQFTGSDEAALKAQMHNDAQKRVRYNLVLEAIAATENLEVTDEELTAEYEIFSSMYNIPVEQIKAMLGDGAAFKNDMKVRKAVYFLKDNRKK